jgi:probable addiction module antidote protein
MEDKKELAKQFRDNPQEVAAYLTEMFLENDLEAATSALGRVLRGQNVQALARESNMRREKLYGSFGGVVDPTLGRVLKLFNGLGVRFAVVPMQARTKPPRPKLGRPRKIRSED